MVMCCITLGGDAAMTKKISEDREDREERKRERQLLKAHSFHLDITSINYNTN